MWQVVGRLHEPNSPDTVGFSNMGERTGVSWWRCLTEPERREGNSPRGPNCCVGFFRHPPRLFASDRCTGIEVFSRT